MTKAGWAMLAMMLIATVSSGCAPDGTTTASAATDPYGSSASPRALDPDPLDPFHTGRDSARQNF